MKDFKLGHSEYKEEYIPTVSYQEYGGVYFIIYPHYQSKLFSKSPIRNIYHKVISLLINTSVSNLHYVTLRYVTLRYVTLRYVTLRSVTLRRVASRYVMLRYVTLCYVMLRYVMLRYVMLYYTGSGVTEASLWEDKYKQSCAPITL